MTLTHRPCGACGELVPMPNGCEHWRPLRVTGGRASGARNRERARAKAERDAQMEQLKRQVGLR